MLAQPGFARGVHGRHHHIRPPAGSVLKNLFQMIKPALPRTATIIDAAPDIDGRRRKLLIDIQPEFLQISRMILRPSAARAAPLI